MLLRLLLGATLVYATLATSSFPLPPGGGASFLPPLPAMARRQMEAAVPLPDREPSCHELRAMWRHMRRMGRQMEFTNEIPKMQDPFVANARYVSRGRSRGSKYPDPNPYRAAKASVAAKEAAFHAAAAPLFGRIVKEQNEVYAPVPSSRISQLGLAGPDSPGFHEFEEYPKAGPPSPASPSRGLGRFGEKTLPEEALGAYGTVVHSPEERAQFRAQSRTSGPSRVDQSMDYGLSKYRQPQWGSGDSTGLGRVPFRPVAPHPRVQYGREMTHRRLPSGGFAEYPQEVGQRGGGGARVERIDRVAWPRMLKNTCLRLQNKPCRTDVDCFCDGSPKLFCGEERCRPLFKAAKYGKKKLTKATDEYQRNMLAYAPKSDPAWSGPF